MEDDIYGSINSSRAARNFKTNRSMDVDDELDAAWAEARKKHSTPGGIDSAGIEHSSSEIIPDFKLSQRSLSMNRDGFRNSPSRRRSLGMD